MEGLHTTDLMPARAARLLAMSPDLLGACGAEGELRMLNPAWTAALGHGEEELLAASWLTLVHPEDAAAARAMLDRVLGERAGRAELTCRLRGADGGYRWIQWAAELDPDDDCCYLAGRDVTERRVLEEELGRREDGLEKAAAELQELAYIASHDLAEPLRMVTSYLELLQRRYQGQLDDTADEFIGFAVGGAVRMKALIDDMLVYSRLGSHDLATAAVDLAELAGHVLLALEPAIEEAGAEVEVAPGLPAAHGDATQLGQLLQNLISNAIKFRAPDRAPRVLVAARERDGGTHVTVADNGIGIAEGHQDRIFKMFARLHGRDEYDGTGIGLALCRRICDRHGGRIWVESEVGAGSTFHVWIPGP
jgi:PAS domain S-box-containing protein